MDTIQLGKTWECELTSEEIRLEDQRHRDQQRIAIMRRALEEIEAKAPDYASWQLALIAREALEDSFYDGLHPAKTAVTWDNCTSGDEGAD